MHLFACHADIEGISGIASAGQADAKLARADGGQLAVCLTHDSAF